MRRLAILMIVLAGVVNADPASRLLQEARRAERRGDTVRAFLLYVQAAGMRPVDPKYRREMERLKPQALQSIGLLGSLQAAAVPAKTTAPVPAAEPANEGATLSPVEARQAVQAAEPPELHPSPGRRSFDLRGNLQSLYEQVARAYGLEVVFDPDLQPGNTVKFRLEDVDFYRAFPALMELTSTFVVPVNGRVALVAADNQNKRRDLEPMMAALIPIPQVMSVEEANEVGRAVQQAMDIRRLVVDANRRQVYLRDTVSHVRLAQALYQELARSRGEIMLEVELLNVSQSTLSHLGLTVPTQIPVTALSAIGNAAPPQLSGPYATFGGGDSRFGIQIGNAGLQADWNQSDTRLLSRFRLRAIEGLPASLHIGDRYPILTSRYSPIVLTDEIRKAQQQGPLLAPFPSFNFEDLGLVLKVTPRLHGDDEVSLALETEFRVLSGTSLNDLPIISSRRFNCTVRLREGEAGLVSGMAVSQVSRSWSGLWPFSRIPLLGRLLRANTSQRDQSELLLVIRPRLTRASPASQFPSRAYYTGTEGRAASSL